MARVHAKSFNSGRKKTPNEYVRPEHTSTMMNAAAAATTYP